MAARGIKWIIRRSDYGIRAATSHLRRNPRFITQRSEGQLVYSRLAVSIPLSLSPIRFLTHGPRFRASAHDVRSRLFLHYKPTTYPGFSCWRIKCNLDWCFTRVSSYYWKKRKKRKRKKNDRDWKIFFIVIPFVIVIFLYRRLITIISLEYPLRFREEICFYLSSDKTD